MPKKPPPTPADKLAGARLKAVRDALRRQQEEFATSIGVKRTTLANWESGLALPDVRAMLRLFHNHGVSIEWIYLGLLRNVPYEIARALELRAADLVSHIAVLRSTLTGGGYEGDPLNPRQRT